MAKLNNVKLIEVEGGEIKEIEYKGEIYKKVDISRGDVEEGDIVRNIKDRRDAAEGNFYEVFEHNYFGTAVLDDVDDEHTEILHGGEIFRKEEPEIAKGHVKRDVKVGDKIRITAEEMTFGDYRNGDVFTVKADNILGGIPYVDVEEIPGAIFHKEFEVVGEETFGKGDIVRVTEDNAQSSRNKKGDIGEIIQDHFDNLPYHVHVVGRGFPNEGGAWHDESSIELVVSAKDRADL